MLKHCKLRLRVAQLSIILQDAAPDMFGVSRAEQQQRQQQEKEGTGGVLNTAATYGAALLKLALELKTSRYDL